jgi:hypothetical protein
LARSFRRWWRRKGNADGTGKETLGHPKPGDFVGFRVFMIADDLPEPVNLIGFIACRLERVFVEGKGWVVAQNYTPKNIKQAIRL